MNAIIEQALDRMEQLEQGIEHYTRMIPAFKSEENITKWSAYLEMAKLQYQDEKSLAVGMIDMKIGQLQNDIYGMTHLAETRKLQSLRERITGQPVMSEQYVVVN